MTQHPKTRDIFFVANEVDELGGVARWQAQMAALLAERGHRVTIVGIAPAEVAMDLGENPPFKTVTLYDRRPPGRKPVHGLRGKVDVAARLHNSRRETGMREASAKLSRMFRAAAPGAMIVVTQVWAMEWVALADTAGHPVIGMSHESYDYSRQSSRFGRVLKHYKDVDRLLLLTQEDADKWAVKGLNNVGFMPNPLPMMPETVSPRSEKTVVSIGRLSHQKGLDMMLDAWAEAAPQVPGWKLKLYGAGELEHSLKKQAKELGLDDSVEWAGQTRDVVGALHGASVFAQSSRGEGFPLALLEAMACGVPCAAFDCAPGVHEIIQDEVDGLLARPGNTPELARQLVRLMQDQEMRDRMGDLARKNVQRYSPESITQRWEELFTFLER
ncbi:glycosyltransferase family 4 protein [Streptomyces sp. NPDC004111]|uniref:glycosyltransferase family 4 protein n=1 Tax=Streptomyces sp. NPDC004111 TaxID=3364690 RepID=UPI003688FFC7